MYVANFDDNTIIKFPASGSGVAGGASGLDGPIGMVIDASNNLYVTNRNAGTVTEFLAAGGVVAGGAGPLMPRRLSDIQHLIRET
jgi:DNA-binding beta-propeller fold protein YncE